MVATSSTLVNQHPTLIGKMTKEDKYQKLLKSSSENVNGTCIYSTNCDMNTMKALHMVSRMYEKMTKITYSDVALNSRMNLNANEKIHFSKFPGRAAHFHFTQLFDIRVQLNDVAEANL